MNTTDLTEHDLAESLQAALEDLGYTEADELPGAAAELAETLAGASYVSFADGGYLTRDAGLVITTADGRRFQITIKEA